MGYCQRCGGYCADNYTFCKRCYIALGSPYGTSISKGHECRKCGKTISIENMSLCHAAYFCKGWESARGCRIEHEVAKAYGLKILYEVPMEDENNDA